MFWLWYDQMFSATPTANMNKLLKICKCFQQKLWFQGKKQQARNTQKYWYSQFSSLSTVNMKLVFTVHFIMLILWIKLWHQTFSFNSAILCLLCPGFTYPDILSYSAVIVVFLNIAALAPQTHLSLPPMSTNRYSDTHLLRKPIFYISPRSLGHLEDEFKCYCLGGDCLLMGAVAAHYGTCTKSGISAILAGRL